MHIVTNDMINNDFNFTIWFSFLDKNQENITNDQLVTSYKIFERLIQKCIPLPIMSILDNEILFLRWYKCNIHLDIEILPNVKIEWFHKFKDYYNGTKNDAEEEIPEIFYTYLEDLGKIYWGNL